MAYREEIKFFSKTFYLILGAVVIVSLYFQTRGISAVLPIVILAGIIPLLFGRLLISISEHTLHIQFGYTGLMKKDIPVSKIKDARVVTYKPIRQFGGWGIRCGKFEGMKTGCYSMRGTRGVLLELTHNVRVCITKTDRVIVGVSSPEKLISALGAIGVRVNT
jgi:hypothetical protein